MSEQAEVPHKGQPSEESKSIATHPEGLIFTDRQGDVNILPGENQRQREEGEDKSDVRLKDFRVLSYAYHENKEQAIEDRKLTEELAKKKLEEFKNGDTHSIATGMELEGILYNNDGTLSTVHGGDVTFDMIPPEAHAAQLEVVSGKTPDGRYPSSAVEISQSLLEAINKGIKVADLRKGHLAFSSVPEGGDATQLKLTDHPKILSSYERGQVGVSDEAPLEVMDLAKRAGVTDILPFNGSHVHTSNPELPDGKFDARAAYAAGMLELTQMSEVESFMLANTKDYLGVHLDHIKDVRSILKRANIGAQDTTSGLPDNAHDLVNDSMEALRSGATHEMSRHPLTGQYDRVRFIKEFGTTESVAGSANPDLRLMMAHTYFKQLMRVLSYDALAATGGDESKVLSYLQHDYEGGKYGYLFEKIPTRDAQNSNFEQDKRFNMDGLEAGNGVKSYREQLQDMRGIVRKLGNEYSAFNTQARIVDHVLGKIAEPPQEGMTLEEYMDPETGMKGGIVTDYKSDNILENIKAQDAGTRKQAAMLKEVQTDQQLLEFFGIKDEKADTETVKGTKAERPQGRIRMSKPPQKGY